MSKQEEALQCRVEIGSNGDGRRKYDECAKRELIQKCLRDGIKETPLGAVMMASRPSSEGYARRDSPTTEANHERRDLGRHRPRQAFVSSPRAG